MALEEIVAAGVHSGEIAGDSQGAAQRKIAGFLAQCIKAVQS